MDKQFTLGEYLSRGWENYKKNAGGYIGFLIVSILIVIIASLIPILGQLAVALFGTALFAGNYYVANEVANNRPTAFGDFFKGFNRLGPFVIYGLISFVISIVILFVCGGSAFVTLMMGSSGQPDVTQLMGMMSAIGIMVIVYLLVYLFLIYVGCFILLKNEDAITAIKSSFSLVKKYIFQHLLLIIVFGLLMVVACIPLGLGLLIVAPLYYITIYYAWRDLSGFEGDDTVSVDSHLI